MAITSQQIVDYLLANPGMTDAQIVAAMEQYGVSPAQMAQAVGLKEGEVAARVGAAIPPNQAVLLGDTYVQAVNQTTGSGENQQVGGLENVITYKASDNKVGGDINFYSPTGEFQQTTKQQEVNATKDFLKFAAITGAGLYGLSALGAGAGTTGLTLSELGGTAGAGALTAAETAALYGAGGSLTAGLTVADIAALEAGLPTGVGSLTAGLTAAEIAAGEAALPTAGGSLTTGLTAAQIAAAEAGLPTTTGLLSSTIPAAAATIPTATAATTAASALTPTAASVLAPAAASALSPTVTSIAKALIPTAVSSLFTPANATNLSNLFSGGLTTAGSLLQQQASKEAAQKAQQRIDAETAAAKQSAAFRPVGMTTRFGTSQFGYDPVTGQMTSAGYTLDPQAKNFQDRLVKLAESGLQQAEGAQAQYAPLQTGAQSLFGLGNKYLTQNPQDVAQNYLNQQMALLQPGRELELANLQTKLRNQGRMGLSVSQGGNLGATTPELQALYNARAQQEAVLAANAQQAGQQQVLYGAGLLGQGANAMGSYYGGQQQAYTPYTTALGGVQNLEALGQQPFNMSNALAQQTSLSGARTGQLGLEGARLSAGLATSANATANPYAQALMAAGNPNAMFGQSLNNMFSGLFGNTPQGSLTTGFTPAQIAATEAGYPIDYSFYS